MLFRAADSNMQHEVATESLKALLSKLKLGFGKSDIAKFVYLVDEDGTGIITIDEYSSTLAAFGVGSEPSTSNIS